MANPEHLKVVKEGPVNLGQGQAWDLTGFDLSRANLEGANLAGAIMDGSNLTNARLQGVSLFAADLKGCDLSKADLSATNLTLANISNANLNGAMLSWARLHRTELAGAELEDATFGMTTVSDCDLSSVHGLDKVIHATYSSIGTDTLARTLQASGGTFSAEQRTFLEIAGVPRTLLDYLPDLLETEPIQFFSCFISYWDGDREFAKRLYDDLRKRSVRCWKYDVDAIIGREVWANISRAISLHEKTIVICSQSSLQRPGVIREIERALQKEDLLKLEKAAKGNVEMDTDVLVPVRLDEYILNGWEHPRKADVIAKHIGDFRDWEDNAKYQQEFQRLLKALDPRANLGLSERGPAPS